MKCAHQLANQQASQLASWFVLMLVLVLVYRAGLVPLGACLQKSLFCLARRPLLLCDYSTWANKLLPTETRA